MAGRQSERIKRSKDQKSLESQKAIGAPEPPNSMPSFTLPESLSCSEVDFPILLRKKNLVVWDEIILIEDERFKEIEEFIDSRKEPILKSPFLS